MIQLEYTIASAAKALKEKTVSATELVRAYLDQIRVRNIVLNAFLDVHEGAALEQAIESDERRAKGEAFGDLDGIPLAIKDNILIEGTRTTAGSRILETYKATNDSTVIKKLRNEGAVFLGKRTWMNSQWVLPRKIALMALRNIHAIRNAYRAVLPVEALVPLQRTCALRLSVLIQAVPFVSRRPSVASWGLNRATDMFLAQD